MPSLGLEPYLELAFMVDDFSRTALEIILPVEESLFSLKSVKEHGHNNQPAPGQFQTSSF